MDYDSMNKEQLKDEAAKRGLPVSGTNQELIERLQQHDRDDMLGPGDPPKTDGPSAAVQPQEPEEPAEKPSSFKAEFECAGELSTGVHLENCRRTWEMAANAGHSPRGGAYAAARTGFIERGGRRYAVYEIPLRK